MIPLTVALERLDIPKRMKRILAVSPGATFGFPDPNTLEYAYRIDCPICSAALDILDDIEERHRRLIHQYEEGILKPIRERNAARRADYWKRREQSLFGRFARTPVYESEVLAEPHLSNARDLQAACERRYQEFVQLRATCEAHWGTGAARNLSLELEAAYFVRHSYRVTP